MSKQITARDERIDFLRGSAAIIVVFGHVLQRFQGYNNSIIFNIIFSIQMPLFMSISGYVNRYSKSCFSPVDFILHIKKRLFSLILPWFCWSMLAYFFLSSKPFIVYLKETSFHMESAFWFLFSLWMIDLLFSIAKLVSSSFVKRQKVIRETVFIFVFICFLVLLLLIGKKVGFSFLGIKYTVYYSIYYLFGYYWGKFSSSIKWNNYKRAQSLVLAVVFLTYCFLISKFNVHTMDDTGTSVIIRIMISLCGCWIAYGVVLDLDIKNLKIPTHICKVGNYSLELYVVHYFVVRMLDTSFYDVTNIIGFSFALLYFVIVFLISVFLIWLINKICLLRCILFGKR